MEGFSSYYAAVSKVIEMYNTNPSKADEIMSEQFSLYFHKKPFHGVCQFIFLTLLRNKFLIECSIGKIAKKKPRKKVESLIEAAFAEIIISEDEKIPKVIHGWVEFAKTYLSKPEANFVNAVLRKAKFALNETIKTGSLSQIYSFPQWLIDRWTDQFGSETTLQILKLSNKPSEVFFRKAEGFSDSTFSKYSQFFTPSKFDNFYILKSGNWDRVKELLSGPDFYIQDPSTTFAIDVLNPKPGKIYLDLCASPGGKSRYIADKIRSVAKKENSLDNLKNDKETLLVSVDMQKRLRLLKQNISKIDFLPARVLACDLLNENLSQKLSEQNLPTKFDAVFIDAPCSNTGVLRRRPDARYRITPDDIKNCSKKQLFLLREYCKYVKDGGMLVYSTCSIDKEENQQVAQDFLEENHTFEPIFSKTFLPEDENDGCGVFVFVKK